MSFFDKLLIALGLKKRPRPTPTPQPEPQPEGPRKFALAFAVQDANGIGLANAKISLDNHDVEGYVVTTNKDGVVDMVVEGAGKHDFTVLVDGYKKTTVTRDIVQDDLGDGFVNYFVIKPELNGPAAKPFGGRVHAQGRFLVNDHGTFRANFIGALTILTKSDDEIRAYLDWVVSTKVLNGIRIFCGVLTWKNQTLDLVYARLPFVLDEARKRGLYVEVSALTDSGTGYDIRAHMVRIAAIVTGRDNVLVELANEPYHDTQAKNVHDPKFLASLRSIIPADILVAYGAARADEPPFAADDDFTGGDFITLHLDRGRDKWNMVRRVRELMAVSETSKKHAFNNEPIKFGSQMDDPSVAYAMAALNRCFEVGGVFHSDAALAADIPTGLQADITNAYLRGWAALAFLGEDRMVYKNVGWSDSPIAKMEGATRSYCFLGTRSVCVVVGDEGFKAQMQNGWKLGQVIDGMPGVKLVELLP